MRTRWEDGTTRTVTAYCKPCNTAKRSEHYKAHPGSEAAAQKRWREKLVQDPVRLAEYREKQAFYHRAWRLRQGGNAGERTNIGTSPVVDARPFADFMRSLGGGTTAIGLACGLDSSYVSKVLKGVIPTIALDTVDRALLHADAVVDGLPVTLDSLYPLDQAA